MYRLVPPRTDRSRCELAARYTDTREPVVSYGTPHAWLPSGCAAARHHRRKHRSPDPREATRLNAAGKRAAPLRHVRCAHSHNLRRIRIAAMCVCVKVRSAICCARSLCRRPALEPRRDRRGPSASVPAPVSQVCSVPIPHGRRVVSIGRAVAHAGTEPPITCGQAPAEKPAPHADFRTCVTLRSRKRCPESRQQKNGTERPEPPGASRRGKSSQTNASADLDRAAGEKKRPTRNSTADLHRDPRA